MLFILACERKLTPSVIQRIKNLPKEKLPIAIQMQWERCDDWGIDYLLATGSVKQILLYGMGVLILSNFQVLIADKVKSRTWLQGK